MLPRILHLLLLLHLRVGADDGTLPRYRRGTAVARGADRLRMQILPHPLRFEIGGGNAFADETPLAGEGAPDD